MRGPFGAVPDDMDEAPPKRFPLASAASEMVYGRNAIAAALRGGRAQGAQAVGVPARVRGQGTQLARLPARGGGD